MEICEQHHKYILMCLKSFKGVESQHPVRYLFSVGNDHLLRAGVAKRCASIDIEQLQEVTQESSSNVECQSLVCHTVVVGNDSLLVWAQPGIGYEV